MRKTFTLAAAFAAVISTGVAVDLLTDTQWIGRAISICGTMIVCFVLWPWNNK